MNTIRTVDNLHGTIINEKIFFTFVCTKAQVPASNLIVIITKCHRKGM